MHRPVIRLLTDMHVCVISLLQLRSAISKPYVYLDLDIPHLKEIVPAGASGKFEKYVRVHAILRELEQSAEGRTCMLPQLVHAFGAYYWVVCKLYPPAGERFKCTLIELISTLFRHAHQYVIDVATDRNTKYSHKLSGPGCICSSTVQHHYL